MINNELINKATGVKIEGQTNFDTLGLINTNNPNSLTFCDTEEFIYEVNKNKNIKGVFVTQEIDYKINRKDLRTIVCDDPRFIFYTLYNYVGKENYVKTPSEVHPSCIINKTAFVSENNVKIGANSTIESNVSILPDVIIGENCMIRAGAVLGSEGFEHKRTKNGILSVFHDGKVILGDNVEVGANTCIDKGFSNRNTIIESFTKIDNLVHIAHGVQTGKRCLIIACSMIAGSVTIGNDVWVGPNANIAPQLLIGNNAFITLGSVVTRNVELGKMVSGNFAIDHAKFIQFIKSIR